MSVLSRNHIINLVEGTLWWLARLGIHFCHCGHFFKPTEWAWKWLGTRIDVYEVGHNIHTIIQQPLLQYDSHMTQLGIRIDGHFLMRWVYFDLSSHTPSPGQSITILFFPNSSKPFAPTHESIRAKSLVGLSLLPVRKHQEEHCLDFTSGISFSWRTVTR